MVFAGMVRAQSAGMSEDAAAAGPALPAQGNKMLLMIMLVFNVLIAGGLGYQVVMGQRGHAAAKAPAGHEGNDKEKASEKFGPLVEIGSLVANLGAPGSGHYIKLTLHVETTNEETKKHVESALVPMRNEALLYLSSVDPQALAGQDRLRVISEEIRKHLVELVGKENVKRVYFSEFVIQ
jgi:flagellar FliL protein